MVRVFTQRKTEVAADSADKRVIRRRISSILLCAAL
jgi:hypothetical protein